ncbi:MAG: hypothetical protein KAI39_07065 [Desulfobulbaceae bacterium]|nr:hypothetical protein [Desulfobulbaceae bacterium]
MADKLNYQCKQLHQKAGFFCFFIRQFPILKFLFVMPFICLLTIAPDAVAAKKRVIFQLANLRQWAELEYVYDGSTYDGENDRESQNHLFEETYHLEIDYAILGRRLANGGLELELGLDQSYENESGGVNRNGSSNGLNLEYQFDMLLFERTTYPATFHSSHNQEQVNAPFTKDYDLLNSHYSAGLALINNYLPVNLNYHYSESETRGLDTDRFQSTEEIRLSTSLKLADINTTDFQIKTRSRQSRIEGPVADTGTDSYSLEINNILDWKVLAQRQILRTTYRRQNDTGASELQSEQLDGRLRLRLGKALETGGSLGYSKIDTPDQFRHKEEGELWIEHQLFNSLYSRYQHNISNIDFATGIEDSWKRQVNLAYTKKLPKDCRFRLAYSYSYGETDRKLNNRFMYVDSGNPEIRGLDAFSVVTLRNHDVLQGSIVVSDSFGVIDKNDYLVRSFGRETKIDFSSNVVGLNPGDEVSVEYTYLVNNSLEYSTTTNAVSGSLDFFNQKFRLYGNLSKTDQNIISGEATVSPLIQQSYMQVGFETTLQEYSFGGSYSYLDSTISKEKYVEAFLNYQKEKKGSVFNLRLIERFSSTQQNESHSGTSLDPVSKNSLMLNVDYRKQLLRNTALTLKTFLVDIRGQGITKDEISLGLLLESQWYKFLLRLSTDVTFQFYDDQTSREERFAVAIRRYF